MKFIDKYRGLLRENKVFGIIICVQVLTFLYSIVHLFSPGHTLTIQPENKNGDFSYIEDSEGYGATFISDEYTMYVGGYRAFINYLSIMDADHPANINNCVASIAFASEINPSAVRMNNIELVDGYGIAEGRVWISSGAEIDDFVMKLYYDGTGTLQIISVDLVEQRIYRCVKTAGMLFLFGLFDSIYIVLWAKGTKPLSSRGKTVLVLAVITVAASLPLFADFVFSGTDNDLGFHMTRITAVAKELENGQFPVRMMTSMLNGYGYANSLYYCDIFLYLPAMLYNMMVPLSTCYQIYAVFINAATCVIGYYVFSRMTHDRNLGLLGSMLYTLSSYRMFNLYIRSAVGEYTAMCFLPLIIYGLWRIYKTDSPKRKDWLSLSIGMAGIIQCHVLSVEIVMMFIILFLLMNIKKTMKWKRLAAFIKAAIVTIGLTAWFVLPFLESMLQMEVEINEKINKIQVSGLYPVQLFGLLAYGDVINIDAIYYPKSISIGISFIAGIAIAVYLCLHRQQWKLEEKAHYKAFRIIFIMALISVVMTLYCIPYDDIENILGETVARFAGAVQFSWRYLSIAMILLSAMCILALAILKDIKYDLYKAAVTVFIGSQILMIGLFYWRYAYSSYGNIYDSNDSPVQTMDIGAQEYLLNGTEKDWLTDAGCQSIKGQVVVYAYKKEHGKVYFSCHNESNYEAILLFPILNYQNYHVYDVKTGEEYSIETGNNNRIQVSLSAGYDGTLEVLYQPPLRWRIAEIISLLCLLSIIATGTRTFFSSGKLRRKG